MILAENTAPMTSRKIGEGVLEVSFGESSVVMSEESVTLKNCKIVFTPEMCNTLISEADGALLYEYKGHSYTLRIEKGTLVRDGDTFFVTGDEIVLVPMPRA